MRVAVVIPNWNGAEFLPETLDGLRRQTLHDFETILVDNASTDGSVESVRASYPEVRCIRLDENRGFAGAVNVGIEASSGEFVVLLNNDAVPEPTWLEALVAALEKDPRAGSCASRVLSYADPSVIDSAGDQLGIFPSQIGNGSKDGRKFRTAGLVLTACACAAAYRRSLFEEIGTFDERFFAYMEDVDIGLRAQFAGYDCRYVPEAVVLHHGSMTGNRLPDFKFYLHMRNALFIFFQYMPLRRMAWAPIVLATPIIQALREKQSVVTGWRALRDFMRDLPTVLRRRRQVRRAKRLTGRALVSRLASPFSATVAFWREHPEAAIRPLPTLEAPGSTHPGPAARS